MSETPNNRALVSRAVSYRCPGGYDVIEIVERTVRAPGPGEIRIKVDSAGVNPTDMVLRTRGVGDQSPLAIPGMDAAGTIESVGPDVSRLHVGQNVMAVVSPRRPDGGAQAEYIVVPAASVVPIPDCVFMAEAATLPLNGLTALLALDLADLHAGQSFAVSGGAGTLASYAIAVAKRQGLKVIADAKLEDFDLVRNSGADKVVERSADFSGAIREVEPNGAHALLDTAMLGESSFGAIRDGGVYLPVRGWEGPAGPRDIKIAPVYATQVLERTKWLEMLRELVHSREIKLRVAGEYPPERVADAQRALERGGLRGRPVIRFTSATLR